MTDLLSGARAELDRLQHREFELLRELLDVRKAVAAQRVVIDELIRANTLPPINRLPNELLAQIFLLIKDERESLASVSRHWRDMIMDIPSIWSEINLDNCETSMQLKLHLERSRQAPLTILLSDDEPELLDIIIPYTNRWHALWILGCAFPVLNRISSLEFPSLEFLFVDLESDSVDLLLTMYSRAPALKHLYLEGLDDPPLPFNLTAGQLGNKFLTKLSLVGTTDSWEFPRESIHFPVLEFLTLRIDDPMSFLEAIVVPKLKHFEFSEEYGGSPICRTFNGPRSKFDNVHHLVLAPSVVGKLSENALALTKEFCQVFHGIRHATIDMAYLLPLFSPYRQVDNPDDYYSSIDNWTCLEILEIRDFTSMRVWSYKRFIDWFTKHTNSGQRRLHLKLISDDTTSSYPVILNASNASRSTLYQALQECCASVELDHIPVSSQMFLSTSAGSLLLSPPVFETGLVGESDIAALTQKCSAQTIDTLLAQFWIL